MTDLIELRDQSDLGWWFPKLEATRVLVPKTKIIKTDVHLVELCDGVLPLGYEDFIALMKDSADEIGFPCFLRTGQTSNKHDWKDSCYVESDDQIESHVANLVEFSELADMLGLPYRNWAVREFLNLHHRFTAFNGMPIAAEARFFFKNHIILCSHPYWPIDALAEGRPSRPDWKHEAQDMNGMWDFQDGVGYQAKRIVQRVADAFDDAWSVDLCLTEDYKIYVTDMARAEHSFHWDGCEMAEVLK